MIDLSKLGIDINSLIIYTVNFGIILFFISRYVTKPFTKILDKRILKISTNLDESEKLRKELELQKNDLKLKQEEFQLNIKNQLLKLDEDIKKRHDESDKLIRERQEMLLETARREIEIEKSQIYSQIQDTVIFEMKKILIEILANKVPEEVIEDSVRSSWSVVTNKYVD